MAARLIIVADQRLLPALARDLGEGGSFDVVAAGSMAEAEAALAGGPLAALVFFFGAPDQPLPLAIQSVTAKVRALGGLVVAVLQPKHAPHRDECMKAGASDLLFMPIPKEQFVGRLADVVALGHRGGPGLPANVSVSAPGGAVKLELATITASGVHATATLPFAPGDTVRLAWQPPSGAPFSAWGVVCPADGAVARIRFSGALPDEEARLREWLRPGSGALPVASFASTSQPGLAPLPVASLASTSQPGLAPLPVTSLASTSNPGLPRAPAMHAPPPGFATRNTRVAPAANAVPTPPSLAAISSPGLKPLTASRPTSSPALEAMVVAGSPSVPPRSASSAELDRLFDEDPKLTPSPAPATDEPLPPMFELGAPWPSLVPAHWAKAAVLALLKGEKQPLPSWNLPVPPPPPPAFDAAPPASGGAAPEPAAMAAPPEPPLPRLEPPDEVAAVARRVVDSVPATERAAIDKPGGEPFVELVATRIALGAAEAEGKRLLAAQQAVLVDGGAHDALTQLADAVAARVQGEADKAMKQGELEALQLVAGARGALSRDLIAFRYVADQLRGLGQHPGLGAGALDPEVHLAAAAPKPAAKPTEASTARASEFGDYREKPRRSRSFALAGAGVLLALGAIYGYSRLSSFARVGLSSGDLEAAGDDVVRIEVSGKIAMVTVKPAFLEQPVPAVAKVVEVLRPKGIERAMVELENGLPLGQIDVSTGRPIYLAPAPGKHPPK